MLSGGHEPSHSAPGRLVCVLGERDVHLLSVRLLQGASVLSVPPVPAMSGAWGWVWWVPAPLGAIWPHDPLGSELGGARRSCVAAVLSGCSTVHLSVRSDLSFSLFVFSPLFHCSRPPRTSSPSSSLRLLCAMSLSLSLSFPLVHGGKGIRFTLSEEIYPEKGTCAARPPLHLPAAAGLG